MCSRATSNISVLSNPENNFCTRKGQPIRRSESRRNPSLSCISEMRRPKSSTAKRSATRLHKSSEKAARLYKSPKEGSFLREARTEERTRISSYTERNKNGYI